MAGNKVERKCPNCGTWNRDGEERCKECGHTLNPQKRIAEEEQEREKKRLELPKTKFDELVERFAQSKNPFVKALYLLLKGLWFVYWVILSFILWLIAATPG